jgi:hypothetical protein
MFEKCELCGEVRKTYGIRHFGKGMEFILESCSECSDIESLKQQNRIVER